MRILAYTQCCGVKELIHIQGLEHEELMNRIHGDMNDTKFAFLTFTSNDGEVGYGTALKDYIEKNKLGVVTMSGCRENPNTRHSVRHFTWEFDHAAFDSHYKGVIKKHVDEKAAREKKEREEAEKALAKELKAAEKTLKALKNGTQVRIRSGEVCREPFRGVAEVREPSVRNNSRVIMLKLSNGNNWYFYKSDASKLEIV